MQTVISLLQLLTPDANVFAIANHRQPVMSVIARTRPFAERVLRAGGRLSKVALAEGAHTTVDNARHVLSRMHGDHLVWICDWVRIGQQWTPVFAWRTIADRRYQADKPKPKPKPMSAAAASAKYRAAHPERVAKAREVKRNNRTVRAATKRPVGWGF